MYIERFPVDDIHRQRKIYTIEYTKEQKVWREVLYHDGFKLAILKHPIWDNTNKESIIDKHYEKTHKDLP